MKGFTSTIATLALAASSVLAQDILFDSAHNATTIIGSWTSGSKDVTAGLRPQTGLGFANPAQMSFTYPTNAGVSYALCVFIFVYRRTTMLTCGLARRTITMSLLGSDM